MASSIGALEACAMSASPSPYMTAPVHSTRTRPKRSAIMPASGWPTPQSRFCSASAKANTSRPQWLALDMGVRKKPCVERGPYAMIAMRQPNPTITAGVRHVASSPECARAGTTLEFLGLLVIFAPATRLDSKAAQHKGWARIAQTKITLRRPCSAWLASLAAHRFAISAGSDYGFRRCRSSAPTPLSLRSKSKRR